MNRDRAKEYVKENIETYLNSVTKKKGNSYICPVCNSGEGKNKSPAGALRGNKFSCFSCGRTSLDTIDLLAEVENLDAGSLEAFDRAYDFFNIEIENEVPETQEKQVEQQILDVQTTPKVQSTQDTQEVDYIDYYRSSNKNITNCKYLNDRGISQELQNKFLIGYVEEWKSPTAVKRAKENGTNEPPATPRIIIPTSRNSYIARDVRGNLNEIESKFCKMKEGKVNIFNSKALQQTDKPITIVEGEIDALSVIEVGGQAIGLGSKSNVRMALELIKERACKEKNVFIIAMDNDSKGQEASKELEQGLKELGYLYLQANISGDTKDPNEYLVKDRQAFKKTITDTEVEASKLIVTKEEKEKQEYLETSTGHHINSFMKGIAESVNTPYFPTKFQKLDEVLDGGLYEGLYIVGAISSLGKTTLILQICDQIAMQGTDVLIFSLEMARSELMSKSISRLTLELSSNPRLAKTNRGITVGSRHSKYSKEEKGLIEKSIIAYSEYANRIFISEGVGDIGINHITDTVKKHIRLTGNTPLVMIDYLQLLAPANERATDKQNTDKAVMELKRLTRDYKTPIIAISSFNRGNYDAPVNMGAFKESGAIEYSSDVLIGLQLRGAGQSDFNVDEAKSKDPREIELKILKNRNGKTGVSVNFNYYPLFNMFTEV